MMKTKQPAGSWLMLLSLVLLAGMCRTPAYAGSADITTSGAAPISTDTVTTDKAAQIPALAAGKQPLTQVSLEDLFLNPDKVKVDDKNSFAYVINGHLEGSLYFETLGSNLNLRESQPFLDREGVRREGNNLTLTIPDAKGKNKPVTVMDLSRPVLFIYKCLTNRTSLAQREGSSANRRFLEKLSLRELRPYKMVMSINTQRNGDREYAFYGVQGKVVLFDPTKGITTGGTLSKAFTMTKPGGPLDKDTIFSIDTDRIILAKLLRPGATCWAYDADLAARRHMRYELGGFKLTSEVGYLSDGTPVNIYLDAATHVQRAALPGTMLPDRELYAYVGGALSTITISGGSVKSDGSSEQSPHNWGLTQDGTRVFLTTARDGTTIGLGAGQTATHTYLVDEIDPQTLDARKTLNITETITVNSDGVVTDRKITDETGRDFTDTIFLRDEDGDLRLPTQE